MKRSTDRILTTHVGSLARPKDLLETMREKEHGRPYDHGTFEQQMRAAEGSVALRASTLPLRAAAVRGGVGIGLLPCFLGDADPLLERLTAPVPELGAEYWVIVHRDLRRAACVRAVIDWIRQLFVENRDELAGSSAIPSRAAAD